MASITLNNVYKRYGSGKTANQVIHGVSAQIADGEFVVVVGPSGCGKSTLLRMVAGLEEITGGEISIGDRVVNDLEPSERDIPRREPCERLRGRVNQVAAPTTDSTMRTADGAPRTTDGAAAADERVELVHTTDNRVPLPNGSADAIVAVNLWHEIYDEPAALDELRRLLAPAGCLAIVDWATVERPIGPCVDHVLSLDQALEVTAGMGLAATAVHPAGSLFPYHYAIVARPRA